MPYRPLPPGNLPDDTPIPGQLAALVIRRLADRLPHEVEAADLQLPDGDTVAVTSIPAVNDWLQGWAVRTDAGEKV